MHIMIKKDHFCSLQAPLTRPTTLYLVGKIAKKTVWRSAFYSKYSAMLSKIHSYILLFRRFCPLGNSYIYFKYLLFIDVFRVNMCKASHRPIGQLWEHCRLLLGTHLCISILMEDCHQCIKNLVYWFNNSQVFP